MMVGTGVIHGRFQVLHNDHIIYLMAGKKRCRHLVVGITNPDPILTKEDPADPQRSRHEANPLTYFERYTMLKLALDEAGVYHQELSIVPLPINVPDLYRYYVPLDATFFLTIYDQWGKRKLEQFQALGLKTEVLWTRSPEEKGLTGSDIRRRIVADEAWEHLVPASTKVLLEAWEIPQRLRTLHSSKPEQS